jgi:hypothetical protein
MFQVLPRVTGERDVVEVEHHEKLHATIGSMRFNLAELPGEV